MRRDYSPARAYCPLRSHRAARAPSADQLPTNLSAREIIQGEGSACGRRISDTETDSACLDGTRRHDRERFP